MTHVIGPWDEIKMSIKISKCTSDKIKSVRFLESYFTLARNFTVLVQSLGSHQPDVLKDISLLLGFYFCSSSHQFFQ